jgi:hypothetical protein
LIQSSISSLDALLIDDAGFNYFSSHINWYYLLGPVINQQLWFYAIQFTLINEIKHRIENPFDDWISALQKQLIQATNDIEYRNNKNEEIISYSVFKPATTIKTITSTNTNTNTC